MVVSIRSGVVSVPWKIELFVMLRVLRMLHCSCSSYSSTRSLLLLLFEVVCFLLSFMFVFFVFFL